MKAILEFNLEDQYERNAHMRAVKSTQAYGALWDIANEIFRSARKHGYKNEAISNLVKKLGPDADELIGLLEKEFYGILEDHEVSFTEYE